jgi:hypothetical protein
MLPLTGISPRFEDLWLMVTQHVANVSAFGVTDVAEHDAEGWDEPRCDA